MFVNSTSYQTIQKVMTHNLNLWIVYGCSEGKHFHGSTQERFDGWALIWKITVCELHII